MKKNIYLTFFLLFIVQQIVAQVPGGFNYQAVLRNNDGELISDQSVNIRISIIDNLPTGTNLYTEIHTTTSNSYGIVNLIISEGTVVSGTFSQINWGENDKYLGIEVDDGSGYVDMGAVQLLSVPYALYSEKALNAENLGSNAVYSTTTDTLFVVKDHDGNVVFAVFPDGAEVIVNETAKGKVGGFAVSGRNPSKTADVNILKVTPDSTRIYVNDTVSNKGKVGGFAVSGRNPSKNTGAELLFINADSTRIYVNDDQTGKAKVGGFAVSGRNPSKGTINDYLQVSKDSTRIYITDSGTKGKVGGFAVSGRNPSKGSTQTMFVTTLDSTRIFTQDTIGGFGVYDNRGTSTSSYMQLTPLNYFIGHNSGQRIEFDSLNPGMGKYNTFFGYKSGENTVSGFKNIFMGYQAGQSNISGGWNIFIGNEAGASVTNALSNIFIGDMAGTNITDGINNIFIGKEAGYNSTTFVSQDLFIGHGAGRSNIDGGGNVYLGISAGYSSTGDENTFVGKHSGFSNTGSNNVHIGSESGIYTSGGSKNIYIGYRAGYRMYGTGNVFIGNSVCNTVGDSYDYSNSIAIGDSVIVTGDNQIRIGNSNATSFYAQGIYSTTTISAANVYVSSSGRLYRSTSSKRYKNRITPIEINTSNIYSLNPVSYTSISDNKRYFGLIAEEVAEVIPELADFAKERDVIKDSNSEKLVPDAVHYSMLSVLLLNEVKKHEETINDQKEQIEILEDKNQELEKRIKKLEELILK